MPPPKKKKVIHSQAREIIAKVIEACEYEAKNKCLTHLVTQATKRAANHSAGNRLIVLHAGSKNGSLRNAELVYKAGSASGDYHGQMNQVNFEKWVDEKLIPNLPPSDSGSDSDSDDSSSNDDDDDDGSDSELATPFADFETLLSMIGPKISKCDTSYRKAIPANERLAVTLRFLATGDSYHFLMYTFKISKQVISTIIPEVCDRLIEALQDFIKCLILRRRFAAFCSSFSFCDAVQPFYGDINALLFPLSSGCGDGSGVWSSCSGRTSTSVTDASYNFTYASVGCQGRISYGGVFNETKFKKCQEVNTMNLPSACALPGTTAATPFPLIP
ncbi:hypothetical protein ANN_13132 [Periplaneta americana]|uniref:DDE Tnp4 domain-containing protein n=1 Tax=Periplaneta americana TaxID=6978 RepID=A0ABQ8TJY0_PERAM|nr:hypothetical protein ANN_13132 [Periplaneta americana]